MDDPHAEVEIKPQLKPRGSATKGEDSKPFHQLYKLQIKSTGSTRQTLFETYKRTLRTPRKENALVLIAVDIEGKNTRSRTRLDYEMHPTAGPETSTVLEGILGRWSGL